MSEKMSDDLLQARLQECFSEYEKHKNVVLPNYLKHLLNASGYDNRQSLSAIDDTDVLQIEEFARHTLPDLLTNQDVVEKSKYYGSFSQKPDQFKILPGHIRLLKDLSSYFKPCVNICSCANVSKVVSEGDSVASDGNSEQIKLNKKRLKKQCETLIQESHAQTFQEVSSEITSNATKLTEEKYQIREALKHWLKQRVCDRQWETYYATKFSEITFNCQIEAKNLLCKISCYCKKTIIIRKFAKSATRKPRWIYSNFEAHLKTHVLNYDKEITREITTGVTQNQAKNSLITNFFSNVANETAETTSEVLKKSDTLLISKDETQENSCVVIADRPRDTPLDSSKTTKIKCKIIEDIVLKPGNSQETSTRGDVEDLETIFCKNHAKSVMENSGESSSVATKVETTLTENVPELLLNNRDSYESSSSSYQSAFQFAKFPVSASSQIIVNNSIPQLAKNFTSGSISSSSPNQESCISSCISNRRFSESSEMEQKSKWKLQTYQRSARKQRARQRQCAHLGGQQQLLTDFFPFVEKFFQEKPEIHYEFTEKLTVQNNSDRTGTCEANNDDKLPYLLNMLKKIAAKNSFSTSNLNSYYDEVKWFCVYLFYTGGRLFYETFQKNLPNVVPSISTLNRFLNKQRSRMSEGYFDFEGLAMYLKDRDLPCYVWIGEDATRITGKIEYDEKTNKIIGFVLPLKDGLPDNNQFYASSADTIERYFLENEKSSYAYVIMAQPLSTNSPAFCLAIFGTNNKFTYKDVLSRWSYIEDNARKFGVVVLGKSSDGDTRLLKAMRIESSLGDNLAAAKSENRDEKQLSSTDTLDMTSEKNEEKNIPKNLKDYCEYVQRNWTFYQMKLDFGSPCLLQDQVHIGTKLRTRLLNPKVELILGDFKVSANHLQLLIETKPKDLHLLTLSDIKAEDKMNFASAERMCSPAVISALEDMPETKGTQMYLRIMNLVLSSTLDETLEVKTRVYNIWFAVFMLRIWRNWLKSQPNLSIQKNFLSLNSFLCIELNAHNLIKLILLFREKEDLSPDMFQPWLFSSQCCEKIFRAIRSLTSTYSTVVNISLQGILERMDRIKTLNGIVTELKNHFVFPRETQIRNLPVIDASIKDILLSDLENVLKYALSDALVESERLGIVNANAIDDFPLMEIHCLAEQYDYVPEIKQNSRKTHLENHEKDRLEDEIDTEIDQSIADITSHLPSDQDLIEMAEEKSNQKGRFLRDYSKIIKHVAESSPYVKLTVARNDCRIIKKSALCWLLDESHGRVSADRLLRFFPKKDKTQNKRSADKAEIGRKNERSLKKAKRGRPKKSKETELEADFPSETETSQLEGSETDTDFDELCSDHSSDRINYNSDSENSNEEMKEELEQGILEDIVVNDFYAVFYDQKYYLGKVIELTRDDKTRDKTHSTSCKMTFLKEKNGTFIWPKKPDEDLVHKKYLFYGPVKFIEEGETYKLKRSVKVAIDSAFRNKKQAECSK